MRERAVLVLEDGTYYEGYAFGHPGQMPGEVVFNTSMTGYQEILTDPSYHGQIVVMTYPQIGNYGVNVYDMQSNRPWVRGFVAREFSRVASNHRAHQTLDEFMKDYGVVGIHGVDTRALVRKIREGGVIKGVIAHGSQFSGPDHRFTREEIERLAFE
ncbi:MAG TPA: carbamoyl phosphate synthase small subunit, partial [Oceanithermus profundus]|nr:carbamoyl phosphate synthase small subunit [Oceanithermus profundus]